MLKDTIISAFNYDGTLLKWLKKVEKALQGDTLTNIEVVTNSDYSMQLKLTFGDNSFIMSPVFTNKGRGIVSITKTATSGLVDTYTVTYTDNTTSTFTVTNAEGFNANNLYSTLTAGTGIELTNDGQNVTVTAKRLLNEIVDSQGRNRFVEANGRLGYQDENIEATFIKYSLSGTHIMFVGVIKALNDITIPAGRDMFLFTIPQWIGAKIVPINADTNIVDVKNAIRVRVVGSDWQTQSYSFQCRRAYGTGISLLNASSMQLIQNDSLRIEFDLLIDTD